MEKSKKKKKVTERSLQNLKRDGRTPGSKNKSTLVKEAIKEGMEDTLMNYGLSVLHATAQAAMGTKLKDEEGNYLYDEFGNHVYINGNDSCKKMILDRMVPIADVTGNKGSGKTEVIINVQGMEARIEMAQDQDDAIIDIEPLDEE